MGNKGPNCARPAMKIKNRDELLGWPKAEPSLDVEGFYEDIRKAHPNTRPNSFKAYVPENFPYRVTYWIRVDVSKAKGLIIEQYFDEDKNRKSCFELFKSGGHDKTIRMARAGE